MANDVAAEAITMGIATILDARRIPLVAAGPEKAAAVAAAVEGSIGTACPASALRLHNNVDVLCDESAAAARVNRPQTNERRRA
ncbi:hypothetical protein Q3C01_42295 [Bradyrhizobium sp. UFLA05-109]